MMILFSLQGCQDMLTCSLSLSLVSGVYEHIKNEPTSEIEEKTFPRFDMPDEFYNVSAFVGQSALLQCVVRDMGDRRVSSSEIGH